MSYCRFGWDDSDVYVFDDSRGGTTCCACQLMPTDEGRPFPQSFNCDTHAQMVAHLEEHRAAGHTVPQDAIDDLSHVPRA